MGYAIDTDRVVKQFCGRFAEIPGKLNPPVCLKFFAGSCVPVLTGKDSGIVIAGEAVEYPEAKAENSIYLMAVAKRCQLPVIGFFVPLHHSFSRAVLDAAQDVYVIAEKYLVPKPFLFGVFVPPGIDTERQGDFAEELKAGFRPGFLGQVALNNLACKEFSGFPHVFRPVAVVGFAQNQNFFRLCGRMSSDICTLMHVDNLPPY
ncbi:MAG: hypothetical protein HFG00_10395 [Oscillibacter sp.]|nr:hypothetical protein [Oscillibacter sp.]